MRVGGGSCEGGGSKSGREQEWERARGGGSKRGRGKRGREQEGGVVRGRGCEGEGARLGWSPGERVDNLSKYI